MSKYLNWTWVIKFLTMLTKGGIVMAKKKAKAKKKKTKKKKSKKKKKR
jgi:hypothetical protein